MANILLVDDDPIYRDLVEIMLERDGHAVTTAENGVQCLRLLVAGGDAPEKAYDLVITDLFMPKMNGADLVAAIREHCGGDIPLIGITGGHADMVRPYAQSFLNLGSNAVLAKPFTDHDLRKVVGQALGTPS